MGDGDSGKNGPSVLQHVEGGLSSDSEPATIPNQNWEARTAEGSGRMEENAMKKNAAQTECFE